MNVKLSLLRRNVQDARPGRSSCNKWHGPLWTECSPEPHLVMWIIPKGYTSSHLSCHSHWDILKRRPNHPSSGYADSDRQLSRDGFGEHALWYEMSSPVVFCLVAVKLKPEKLRVAKRLSHCCGKNLHDWRPQASSAESVSIQSCVVFFSYFFIPGCFSSHEQSGHLQHCQFWGRAKIGYQRCGFKGWPQEQNWKEGRLSELRLWTAPGSDRKSIWKEVGQGNGRNGEVSLPRNRNSLHN